ncbi:MAG: VWA domain-containing protein [Bacteroidetes bacterium]|nr:VWA domain-containing protein [Bacteroidota bacterium]
MRYTVLFVAALMLLEPKLETRNRQLSPPVIAILHDDSESILINRDSTYLRSEYPAKLKAFMEKLNANEKVKTHFFAFSNELGADAAPDSLSYRGMGTNISNALTGAGKLFSNQNLGAVVLLSDGISTSGMNPIYSLDNFQQPVYTVLLGDTTPQKDIRIGEVLYNQIAYLENETPIKVKVMSTGYDAVTAKVSLIGGGKVLGSQTVNLGKDKSIVDADFW